MQQLKAREGGVQSGIAWESVKNQGKVDRITYAAETNN